MTDKPTDALILLVDNLILSCVQESSVSVLGSKIIITLPNKTAEVFLNKIYPFCVGRHSDFAGHLSYPVCLSLASGNPRQPPNTYKTLWSDIVELDIKSPLCERLISPSISHDDDLGYMQIPCRVFSL